MYLTKRTYVRNSTYRPNPEKEYAITVTRGGKPFTAIKPERVTYVIEKIMYWRKANAIHGWFVQNCQGGRDECQETEVSADDLAKLRDTVAAILTTDDPAARDALARETLPPKDGFFFGSTEIDEDYYQDLRDTHTALFNALNELEYGVDAYFYYQSSW